MILKLFMIICLVETLVFQEMIFVIKWDEQEFNWIDRSIFDCIRLSDVQRQFMVNEHNPFSLFLSFVNTKQVLVSLESFVDEED